MTDSLELLSVFLNLGFLVFLIREKRICWIFGILGSMSSIALMYLTLLYSEALLYVFYVFMGIYGYYSWGKDSAKSLRISEWKPLTHLLSFIIGGLLTLGLGTFFDRKTEADFPYLDAFSTSFSFVATFMETRKILSGWLYWIVLNIFTSWLYFRKEMYLYAGLMALYALFSGFGYYRWKKAAQIESIEHG